MTITASRDASGSNSRRNKKATLSVVGRDSLVLSLVTGLHYKPSDISDGDDSATALAATGVVIVSVREGRGSRTRQQKLGIECFPKQGDLLSVRVQARPKERARQGKPARKISRTS